MSYYAQSAAQHRAWEHKWSGYAASWFEQTLGRLTGSHARCVDIAEFHGTAAAQYMLLAQGCGMPGEASRLEWRIGLVMQHAIYGKEACADIVTPCTDTDRFNMLLRSSRKE